MPISPRLKTLREKCPYSELFWSVFSRIRPEYGEIQFKCGKMQTKITQNADTFYALKMFVSEKKKLIKISEVSCVLV